MKQVFFISPLHNIPPSIIVQLQFNLNYQIHHYNNFYELLPLISNPCSNIDAVLLDIPSIYNELGSNTVDTLSTMTTLLRYTLQRDEVGKTNLRKVSIIASLNASVEQNVIKEIYSMDINGIYPDGFEFSDKEKELAWKTILGGDKYFPQYFKDIARPSKKIKRENHDEIILTPRQEQIVKLICDRGASNKVIAKLLNISVSTVKLHVTSALRKFNARNRTQLVLFASEAMKKH